MDALSTYKMPIYISEIAIASQGKDSLSTKCYDLGVAIVEVEMVVPAQVQYVSNEEGQAVSVIVPIELWREITSELETAYLLKSETMKTRLLVAKERTKGISLEDARAQLGI